MLKNWKIEALSIKDTGIVIAVIKKNESGERRCKSCNEDQDL
jgi:hypothetical protein